MITHVAKASEERGRVVLHIGPGHPNPVAIEAAIRVARAFEAGIESVFVEDQQLFDLACYPFAREISLTGHSSRVLSPEHVTRELKFAAQAVRRKVEQLARAAEIPLRSRVIRDEPLRALALVCAECGPWNVVALADAFTGNAHTLRRLLNEVADATGVVVVGPKARRTRGAVVVALEELEHLPAMLRTAERLVGEGDEIVLLLIGTDEEGLHWMEGEVRLAIGANDLVRIRQAEIARGAASVIAEALRRLEAGFVISHFGGLVVPDEPDGGTLKPLAAALECPLFLVR
jgi:hypothetical protein